MRRFKFPPTYMSENDTSHDTQLSQYGRREPRHLPYSSTCGPFLLGCQSKSSLALSAAVVVVVVGSQWYTRMQELHVLEENNKMWFAFTFEYMTDVRCEWLPCQFIYFNFTLQYSATCYLPVYCCRLALHICRYTSFLLEKNKQIKLVAPPSSPRCDVCVCFLSLTP